MPGKYPTDRELAAQLKQLQADQNLTHRTLAVMLAIPGVSETFLSKYLNDNLDRQVDNFEMIARDVLKGITERIKFGNKIFESSVTRNTSSFINLQRRTGDIGLITSSPGNGKTSAIRAFLLANPSAIGITATASARDARKQEGLLFNALDNRDWKGTSRRYDLLVDRCKGSSRPILIDNAHRLDASGRQFWFDFHDETENPITYFAEVNMIDKIRADKYALSRIGMNATYELEEHELPECSHQVTEQFSDRKTADAISDLVTCIASHGGVLRSVRKTVVLAEELRKLSAKLRDDPRAAIRAAHSRLVRDYALPSD